MKLVDTSSWIEYFREKKSSVGDRVEALVLKGDAAWCDMTLIELWSGARGAMEKKQLAEMEGEIEKIAVDQAVWHAGCKLALRCRESGISVPVTDIIIAACAATNALELEHCDKHFHNILPLAISL